ncbi:MAG TPA: alpha/beta fold hydrolase [Candidatus Acidoferrum sp.]|nr:alpha/beta fold hydrolase [Candidatus Acidoferrum sp.]
MKRCILWICAALLVLSLLSIPVGYWVGTWALHPTRRDLTPQMISEAEAVFRQAHATKEDLDVTASDGVTLRAWLVRPAASTSEEKEPLEWVLIFHGIADNRMGVFGQATFLLRAGYGIVLMDSRAHGESGGAMTTLGWKERDDVRAILTALESRERPRCIFALGVSMGASIALQAAAEDPRIAGVIAEAPFSSLREVGYDYAGLRLSPWLGRTLFRPGLEAGLIAIKRESGFSVDAISPVSSVSARAFPVFLISDGDDRTIPTRHDEAIYKAAKGPKRIWNVSNAPHAAGLGTAPEEYESRCLDFLHSIQCKGPTQ